MRKTLLSLLFPVFIFPALFAQNVDSAYYVKQFAGSTVGAKVAAAQAACNPDTSIPCIIVFDPSLVKYATGTLPAQCAQCQWLDYRGGLPYVAAGAGTGYGVKAPQVDITANGAKCDGVHDDTAAVQSTLTALAPTGGAVTNPSGATCVINSSITVTFNSSPLGPLTIDTRGGKWLFKATSGTDIHFVIGATNVFVSGLNLDKANFEDAGNGASVLLDIDGSGLSSTGLSKITLSHSKFIVDGYTTTAVQIENAFQGLCEDSGVYAPYTSIGPSAEGHYGFALLQPANGGQNTADWTFTRCESFGFDHGLYSDNVNEVKIFSGTYLLAYEENIDLDGSATLEAVHSENAWDKNPTGLPGSPAQMASVECVGPCTVKDLTTANESPFGNANASLLVFAGINQFAKVEGGLAFSTENTFAYLGTGAGAEIDLTCGNGLGIGSACYQQYTGSGGIFPMNSGSFYGNFVAADQNSHFQWIQTGADTGKGYIGFGKYDTPNGYIPAIFFAEGQGGFWVVGGYAIEQGNIAHFFKCSNLTGTPPNLGTPAGCVDGTLGSSTSLLSDVTSLCRSDGTHCPSGVAARAGVVTGTTCTTPGTGYSSCTLSVTWFSGGVATPFADTSYAASCTAGPPTAGVVLHVYISGLTTSGATVTLQDGTNSGAVATTTNAVYCTAVHI